MAPPAAQRGPFSHAPPSLARRAARGGAFAARHPALRCLHLDVSECGLPHRAVRALVAGIRSSRALVECHLTIGAVPFDPLGSCAADTIRTIGELRALETDERLRCTVY